jgi:hypothetical protein
MPRLQHLISESLHVIREARARYRRLAVFWSMGKDSTLLLWLCRKAFLGCGALSGDPPRHRPQAAGDRCLPGPSGAGVGPGPARGAQRGSLPRPPAWAEGLLWCWTEGPSGPGGYGGRPAVAGLDRRLQETGAVPARPPRRMRPEDPEPGDAPGS